jgi:hypothetical protein
MVSDYEAYEFRTAASASGASGYALKRDLADLEAILLQSLRLDSPQVNEDHVVSDTGGKYLGA